MSSLWFIPKPEDVHIYVLPEFYCVVVFVCVCFVLTVETYCFRFQDSYISFKLVFFIFLGLMTHLLYQMKSLNAGRKWLFITNLCCSKICHHKINFIARWWSLCALMRCFQSAGGNRGIANLIWSVSFSLASTAGRQQQPPCVRGRYSHALPSQHPHEAEL